MPLIEKCDKDAGVTRRDLIKGVGMAAVGAAIVSTGGFNFVSEAEAGTKFNLDKAGKIAYENYGKVYCTETVIKGLVAAGGLKGLEASNFFWGHGGIAGWGTACGTLIGAGVVAGHVVKDKDQALMVVNDVMAFYAYNVLPVYTPKKIVLAKISAATKAGTPLCHISVGKWMKEENVKFFSKERAERCGRLAADVAIYTGKLLNQVADGTYKPSHPINLMTYNITTQENCTDCHGGAPGLPGF